MSDAGSISVQVELDTARAIAQARVAGEAMGRQLEDGVEDADVVGAFQKLLDDPKFKQVADRRGKTLGKEFAQAFDRGRRDEAKKRGDADDIIDDHVGEDDDYEKAGDRKAKRYGDAFNKRFDKENNKGTGAFRRAVNKWTAIIASFAETVTVGLVGAGSALTALVSSLGFALSSTAALIPVATGLGAALATIVIGSSGVGTALGAINEEFATAIKEGREFNLAAEEIQEAFANLTPNAQRFAEAFVGIRGALAETQAVLQERLFEGLGDALETITFQQLPGLTDALGEVGNSLSNFAGDFVDRINQFDLGSIVEGFIPTINNILTGIGDLTSAFFTFIEAATPAGQRLSAIFGAWADDFAAFISATAESGALAEFLDQAINEFQRWADLIGATGELLATVFSAGAETGGGFIERLTEIIETFNGFLQTVEGQNALATFFETGERVVSALGDVLGGLAEGIDNLVTPGAIDRFERLAQGIGDVLPFLGQLLEAVGRTEILNTFVSLLDSIGLAFQPILPVVQQFADLIGSTLGGILQDLQPVIAIFAQAFADILTAVSPLLPLFGELVGAIGGAFGKVVQALVPVFESLADVAAKIIPILTRLFNKLADSGFIDALADALIIVVEAIGEFFDVLDESGQLDAFVEVLVLVAETLAIVLEAISPLIPILTVLLAEAVQALIPIIEALATGLQKISEDVVPVLIPIIEALAVALGYVLEVLGGVLEGVVNIIAEIILAAGDIIAQITTFFTETLPAAFEAVVTFFSNLFTAISSTITAIKNFVVEGFTGFINFVKTAVPAFVTSVINFFRNLGSSLISTISNFVSSILGTIGGWISSMSSAISGFVSSAASTISGWVSNVIGFFSNLASTVISSVSSFIGNVVSTIGSLPGRAAGALSSLASSILGKFTSMFSSVISGVTGWISTVVGFVAGLPGKMVSALGDVAGQVYRAVGRGFQGGVNRAIQAINDFIPNSVGVGPISLDLPDNPLPTLNLFAKGALVNRPTAGIFGEAGSELLLPLNRSIESMDRAVQPFARAMQLGFRMMNDAEAMSGIGIARAHHPVKQTTSMRAGVTNYFTINESGDGRTTAMKVINRQTARL